MNRLESILFMVGLWSVCGMIALVALTQVIGFDKALEMAGGTWFITIFYGALSGSVITTTEAS